MQEISQKVYKAYVFVCENTRDDGRKSCGATEPGLRLALKEAVKTAGLPVRVVATSCLDCCNTGPIIMIVHIPSEHVRLAPSNLRLPPLTLASVHIDDIPEIVGKLQHYTEGV